MNDDQSVDSEESALSTASSLAASSVSSRNIVELLERRRTNRGPLPRPPAVPGLLADEEHLRRLKIVKHAKMSKLVKKGEIPLVAFVQDADLSQEIEAVKSGQFMSKIKNRLRSQIKKKVAASSIVLTTKRIAACWNAEVVVNCELLDLGNVSIIRDEVQMTEIRIRTLESKEAFSLQVGSSEVADYLVTAIVHVKDNAIDQFIKTSLLSTPTSTRSLFPIPNQVKGSADTEGWTDLLNSLVCALLFNPKQMEIFQELIQQLLVSVRTQVKEVVNFTVLKLVSFKLPYAKDEIPSIVMTSYDLERHSYDLDVKWAADCLEITLLAQGSKGGIPFGVLVKLKHLNLSAKTRVLLPPTSLDDLKVSFIQQPHIKLKISSEVKLGYMKLPFQRSIEKILLDSIHKALAGVISDMMLHPKFLDVGALINQEWDLASRNSFSAIQKLMAISRIKIYYDWSDDPEVLKQIVNDLRFSHDALNDYLSQIRASINKVDDYYKSLSAKKKVSRPQ